MPGLISDGYRTQQETLHENPEYGIASVQFAPMVARIVEENKVQEILDYGAGKGRLGGELKELIPAGPQVYCYDPARPEWAEEPEPREFVVCIDVLEHIEPDYLDKVLDHLNIVTRKFGFFTVHTEPALKSLPDGRNAHLIQEPAPFWLPKFMERFELLRFQLIPFGFFVIVGHKAPSP